MWFWIQSEGFITASQTGGDIPPNWGHQSSCCCVLSSVQILLLFFIYSLFLLPLFFLTLSPPSCSLSLGSALISSPPTPTPTRLHFKYRRCARAAPHFCQERETEERQRGEVGREERVGAIAHSWCFITSAASRHLGPSFFFPMSTSVSLTGLIWALIS